MHFADKVCKTTDKVNNKLTINYNIKTELKRRYLYMCKFLSGSSKLVNLKSIVTYTYSVFWQNISFSLQVSTNSGCDNVYT